MNFIQLFVCHNKWNIAEPGEWKQITWRIHEARQVGIQEKITCLTELDLQNCKLTASFRNATSQPGGTA
jgi:hypothetical protein